MKKKGVHARFKYKRSKSRKHKGKIISKKGVKHSTSKGVSSKKKFSFWKLLLALILGLFISVGVYVSWWFLPWSKITTFSSLLIDKIWSGLQKLWIGLNNHSQLILVILGVILFVFVVILLRMLGQRWLRHRKSEKKSQSASGKDAGVTNKASKNVGRKPEKVIIPQVKVGTYETWIDALYQRILRKNKFSLDEAVKEFKVRKELVEEWAKILESHNLIEIRYPTLGSIYFVKKEESKSGGSE
jgi:hypothetical protein